MTLTDRDKKIAFALIPVVVIFAYWFLLLAPKRTESAATGETLTMEQSKLADVESQASTLGAAKSNFAADYAAVLRLGKAIPTSVDMPSLLVQLERAAAGTGITFESVTVGERGAVEGAAAPSAGGAAPAPGGTAPSGQPPVSGPGQAAASAQGATDSANATNEANQQAATTDPGAAGAPAPGTASTSAPPAGGALESVPLDFSFKGSFFELADLFHKLKRFVYVTGDKVRVRGRLMTVDSVSYSADPESFPVLTATVKATVFLTPQEQGATAGATPAGPPPAAAATTPPTSTASTGGGSATPTPTATATP